MNPCPVARPGRGESESGMRKRMATSITRPANTTQYAAGDVIGTSESHVMTFQAKDLGAADVNRGVIVSAMVIDSAAQSTLPVLELWLFGAAPAAQADNAAFAVTDAELLELVGVIPLTYSYVGLASGNCVLLSDPCSVAFECAAGSEAIYGALVVRNTYTPISGEVFKVVLSVV